MNCGERLKNKKINSPQKQRNNMKTPLNIYPDEMPNMILCKKL